MTRHRKRGLLPSVVVCAALAGGCPSKEAGHEHASEHPEGHDHHAEDHGHGETPMRRITRWTDAVELFLEHPAAVAGQPLRLLAHVTVLDGFRALEPGQVALELQGPASATAVAGAPVRPGIYELSLVPPRPGKYRGELRVKGSGVESVIEGLELEVFDSAEQAAGAVSEPEEEHYIELLKEQQWGIPFATAFARQGSLVASIEVAGAVGTPPGGSAEIGAPSTGRIIAPDKGLPHPGQSVRAGEVLAQLAPAPSSPEEAARAGLAVTEAQARASAARAALERAQRLIADEAISQRELEDARRELAVAEQAVRAASSTERLFSGARAGSGAGSWRLVSPIAGTLAEVRATAGSTVAQGELLFRVVNLSKLWIRARVPEQDAARLRADKDASFQIAGLDSWLPIDVTAPDATASVVTVGRTVDPGSRTVDVIYALHEPDPRLRVGGLVRVSLPAGDDFSGVVVPRSALVDDDGLQVVYVQVDGEHFEERKVRAGPVQGELAGIVSGLSAGERIVTAGANVVRLAASGGSETPHGHIH